MSQFERGDIVEYHAVDPAYESFNGHTGMVESVLVNGSGIEEYTISWLTNMGVEVREPERVASGWRAKVLRKVTHVEVPNDAV